ncbi:MAG: D-amino-acid transaminase [Alphaproteobacteria bacterium]|nr:D-amino-acid transaminase [Alphaproteobacteria bacterium]
MTSHHWPHRAPSGRTAYVNGRFVPHGHAGVHIEDRGLQLGDAVYEVFLIRSGSLCDEPGHLDRLERSVGEIEMAMPMGRAALRLVMRELVRRNRVRDGFLYLQVTRGAVKRDHPFPSAPPRPTLIMTARPFDLAGANTRAAEGIAVVTRPDARWGRCDIKTTQLLANAMAKTEARRAGGYEAWLVDEEGFVTEGASTTAWIVDADGRVITRALSNAILPGVTRRVILEAAAEAQIPVVERAFTPDEAKRAREAFISSASGAAVPVVTIDGVAVGDGKPGPLTRRIAELHAMKNAGADP